MNIVNTKDIMRVFATELNERMETKGVTVRQVSLATHVSRANIYSYRYGKTFPDLYSLVMFADYFNCSVDELLGYRSNVEGCGVMDLAISEKEFADEFRDRLQEYMESKTCDVKELAERSGISANSIDMYLSVHRLVPRTVDFIRICSALECTPSELLGY